MALTRKMLKAMSVEDEKIDQIIEAHSETVDALKKERDKYKEDAEKLPKVQSELDEIKSKQDDSDDDSYKEKYEKEHDAFEAYKKQIVAEKAKAEKQSAYKALLKEVGISEKRHDAIIKLTSMDDIELEDGKIKDADKVKESIKKEWPEFIVKEGKQGADVATPPAGDGSGSAKELSRAARVAAKHNELMYGTKGDKE